PDEAELPSDQIDREFASMGGPRNRAAQSVVAAATNGNGKPHLANGQPAPAPAPVEPAVPTNV
ncbi:MAG: hypothetical protein AB7I48_28700, partial [Planctomycetaceae bacterium]